MRVKRMAAFRAVVTRSYPNFDGPVGRCCAASLSSLLSLRSIALRYHTDDVAIAMVSRHDSYGIAMRLVAGTRPATTLAVSSGAILAVSSGATLAVFVGLHWLFSSAGMPTPLRLLIVMTGLPDFCLLDFYFCLLDFRISLGGGSCNNIG